MEGTLHSLAGPSNIISQEQNPPACLPTTSPVLSLGMKETFLPATIRPICVQTIHNSPSIRRHPADSYLHLPSTSPKGLHKLISNATLQHEVWALLQTTTSRPRRLETLPEATHVPPRCPMLYVLLLVLFPPSLDHIPT